MWQDKLKEIIYILENSDINEIDLNFWGRKYRVVKSPGINIVDEITYALPLEAFRSIVHPLFIKPQLKKIFSFRFQIIQDKFNNKK